MEKTGKGITRRTVLKAGVVAAVTPVRGWVVQAGETLSRKGRIHQSVCQWCYKMPLEDLCAYAAKIGLKGVDLLKPEQYEVPHRFGIICTMGYAGGGDIGEALNRPEHHAAIEE